MTMATSWQPQLREEPATDHTEFPELDSNWGLRSARKEHRPGKNIGVGLSNRRERFALSCERNWHGLGFR